MRLSYERLDFAKARSHRYGYDAIHDLDGRRLYCVSGLCVLLARTMGLGLVVFGGGGVRIVRTSAKLNRDLFP